MASVFGNYNRTTNNDEDLDLFSNQTSSRAVVTRNRFTIFILLAILLLFISLLLYKFNKVGSLGFFIMYLIVGVLSFLDFISL